MMNHRFLISLIITLGWMLGAGAWEPLPIVFDSPAENDRGGMMLGNGELGALVWVSADGTLHAEMQCSDSWNEGGQHVKIGAIDYVTGCRVDGGFHQELSLARGEFDVSWTSNARRVSVHCRVQNDPTQPFVVVDVRGAPAAEAKVVNWRLYEGGSRLIPVAELDNRFVESKRDEQKMKLALRINSDVLVENGWYHLNRNETVSEMMGCYDRWQATAELGKPDDLSGRAFGGITRTYREEGRTLFVSAITCLQPVEDGADWRRQTERILSDRGWDLSGEAAKRAEHERAWREFWGRSHVVITPAANCGSVMSDGIDLAVSETCAAVTRAWACQRYLGECAGRGHFPIRFNGSTFTASENGNRDYRQWGHGYWWQNTRLMYYPMLAAGDGEQLKSLFGMYERVLEFNRRRTRKYLGHDGAYFPECMQMWGDHFVGTYGYDCEWKDRKDKLQKSGWHKYEWVGQLELSLMLLNYYDYTRDEAWFRRHALPSIREYVRYFDAHYSLGADGKYDWQPAQALETWWKCTAPMTEVAGLRGVTARLLALPESLVGGADRELFAKIAARTPSLPTRNDLPGGTAYAPAASWDQQRNYELPELYCVYPFRLCSFEKDNVELGRRAYAGRKFKLYTGWSQDELFAATLGMTEEARKHIVERVLRNSMKEFRWPAYWGLNFLCRLDQSAGGIIQDVLQIMLLQTEGDKLYLLPAWPKDWNVTFRLHAPQNTVVEGRVADGKLQEVAVTPESRRADLIVSPEFLKGDGK